VFNYFRLKIYKVFFVQVKYLLSIKDVRGGLCTGKLFSIKKPTCGDSFKRIEISLIRIKTCVVVFVQVQCYFRLKTCEVVFVQVQLINFNDSELLGIIVSLVGLNHSRIEISRIVNCAFRLMAHLEAILKGMFVERTSFGHLLYKSKL
jgi:hypothetical protein